MNTLPLPGVLSKRSACSSFIILHSAFCIPQIVTEAGLWFYEIMNPDLITWMWCIGGLALIIAEYFLPHFFAGFLGVAAIIVGLLRWTGLVTDFVPSFLTWAVTSTVLLLTLRQLAIKKLHAESSYQMTDEDVEAVGEIVEVVSTVGHNNNQGRIRFRGTTWPAMSREGTITAGSKVRLLYRDNLNWIVEPHPSLTERSSHPVTEKEKG